MVSVLQGADLKEWWLNIAEKDLREYITKAEEYGSYDLHVVGEILLHTMEKPPKGVDPKEVGILFYLLGKIARVASAYEAGTIPSRDTWHDIVVYAMMARLFRAEALNQEAETYTHGLRGAQGEAG